MKKSSWITIIIIVAVLIFAYYLISVGNTPVISEELARCIGENSVVYVQFGCHACETQERMFGGNYKYMNSIDCFVEREKCPDITATPTWIINDQKYIGVQSAEELKILTGC